MLSYIRSNHMRANSTYGSQPALNSLAVIFAFPFSQSALLSSDSSHLRQYKRKNNIMETLPRRKQIPGASVEAKVLLSSNRELDRYCPAVPIQFAHQKILE